MAQSTDTLGEKGESEKRSGFWLAFCLVGKFVQSSDGLAILLRKGDQMRLQALVGSVGTVEIISARGA